MEVTLLWFECKNPDCGYIPLKTKAEKVKRAWKHGQSVQHTARKRLFLKYAEGEYIYKYNRDLITFECKYGNILMYDAINEASYPNSFAYPLRDKELCPMCVQKAENERLMQL